MRTRPIRAFSAAFVIVGGGCGELWTGPSDDAPTIIDAELYSTENPPSPDAWPTNPVGVCGPSVARDPGGSCEAVVCAVDATCCTTIWDERCVDLADARCPDTRCVDTIGVPGVGGVDIVTWTGAELQATPFWLGNGTWGAMAWDGDWWAAAGDAELFVNPPSGWIPGGAEDGRRVRWADINGEGAPVVVSSGSRGVYWSNGDWNNTIATPETGTIGDFAIADIDGDIDLDLIVGFVDGSGTRLYRRAPSQFNLVAGAIGPDARTVEVCDVDGNGARDVLLVEADRLGVFPLGVPLGAALFADVMGTFADATCGDLDGDGKDEIIATQDGGPVRILDHDGAIAWTAPESLAGSGVDTGDLDGDGDVDLVVSETGAGAHVHVYWNRGETPLAFDHLLGPVLGDDLGRLDLTRLGAP